MCLPVLRFQVSTREFINMGIVRWIGVFCFLFVFSFSFSQSINDIKKKKERTEKEIAYLNKLLKEADKDKSATVEKLTIINQKISKGKEMLQSLRNEAAYLEKLIADNAKIKTRLEHDKQQMLDLYSKMVYETWKKRGKHDVPSALSFCRRDLSHEPRRCREGNHSARQYARRRSLHRRRPLGYRHGR